MTVTCPMLLFPKAHCWICQIFFRRACSHPSPMLCMHMEDVLYTWDFAPMLASRQQIHISNHICNIVIDKFQCELKFAQYSMSGWADFMAYRHEHLGQGLPRRKSACHARPFALIGPGSCYVCIALVATSLARLGLAHHGRCVFWWWCAIVHAICIR